MKEQIDTCPSNNTDLLSVRNSGPQENSNQNYETDESIKVLNESGSVAKFSLTQILLLVKCEYKKINASNIGRYKK